MKALRLEFVDAVGQLEDFLRDTDAELYRATNPKRGRESSIGAHVRHCLDHLETLASAFQGESLCYDRRRREIALEASPKAAHARLAELRRQIIGAWDSRPNDRPLRLETLVEESSDRVHSVPTALSREIHFVTSHTVHHMALIRLLAVDAGPVLPARFGKALSTRAHELKLAGKTA